MEMRWLLACNPVCAYTFTPASLSCRPLLDGTCMTLSCRPLWGGTYLTLSCRPLLGGTYLTVEDAKDGVFCHPVSLEAREIKSA